MIVLAHGVGGRSDLPAPLTLTLLGAGTAVLFSFLALRVLWLTPRLQGTSGQALPARVTALLDAPATRTTAQALTLTLAAFVTGVALAGPPGANRNIAPWVLYVSFWVGLVPASLLLGPVWRYVNPLRLVHRLLARVTGPPPVAGVPVRLGYWPAAAGLLVFVWLELVYPGRADPGVVGIFLVVYAAVQLVAALWCGQEWFARGDAFEVYSTLLGRLSPLGRDESGRLVVRNPLRGPANLAETPGLVAVAVVLVGSTAFDGLSRTRFWTEGPGVANDTTSGTVGLLFMITLVGTLYLLATEVPSLGRRSSTRWSTAFAHTLLPIAVGYAVAHYFSLFLLDGQTTWILASNPLGADGVDLFGTYGNAIDYTLVSTSAIALVQVGAIVVGHVLGVVLAHDRALQLMPEGATALQLPLVMTMVVFTVGGLALLFSV